MRKFQLLISCCLLLNLLPFHCVATSRLRRIVADKLDAKTVAFHENKQSVDNDGIKPIKRFYYSSTYITGSTVKLYDSQGILRTYQMCFYPRVRFSDDRSRSYFHSYNGFHGYGTMILAEDHIKSAESGKISFSDEQVSNSGPGPYILAQVQLNPSPASRAGDLVGGYSLKRSTLEIASPMIIDRKDSALCVCVGCVTRGNDMCQTLHHGNVNTGRLESEMSNLHDEAYYRMKLQFDLVDRCTALAKNIPDTVGSGYYAMYIHVPKGKIVDKPNDKSEALGSVKPRPVVPAPANGLEMEGKLISGNSQEFKPQLVAVSPHQGDEVNAVLIRRNKAHLMGTDNSDDQEVESTTGDIYDDDDGSAEERRIEEEEYLDWITSEEYEKARKAAAVAMLEGEDGADNEDDRNTAPDTNSSVDNAKVVDDELMVDIGEVYPQRDGDNFHWQSNPHGSLEDDLRHI